MSSPAPWHGSRVGSSGSTTPRSTGRGPGRRRSRFRCHPRCDRTLTEQSLPGCGDSFPTTTPYSLAGLANFMSHRPHRSRSSRPRSERTAQVRFASPRPKRLTAFLHSRRTSHGSLRRKLANACGTSAKTRPPGSDGHLLASSASRELRQRRPSSLGTGVGVFRPAPPRRPTS